MRRIIACCALALLCLVLSACGNSATALQSGTPTNTAIPIPTDTSTPYFTPTPSPTPSPKPIAAALIGGPVNAFDDQYGAPSAAMGWDIYVVQESGPREVVRLMLGSGMVTGNDGQQHAGTMAVNEAPITNSATWVSTFSSSLYSAFIPNDAQQVGPAQTSTSNGQVTVTTIYYSADLAATFPASAFTDASGNRVPPGTFVVGCWADDVAGGTCGLALGTSHPWD